MTYAKDGDLRKYMNSNYEALTWRQKLEHLTGISQDLRKIHDEELTFTLEIYCYYGI